MIHPFQNRMPSQSLNPLGSLITRRCGVLLVTILLNLNLVIAHPMGNFSISHYSKIKMSARSVDLLYIIDMAEIPTFQEKPLIDANSNGDLDAIEKGNYLSRKVEEFTSGLRMKVNEMDCKLQRVSEQIELLSGSMNLPTMKITLRYHVDLGQELRRDTNSLQYQDSNFPGRVGWKEIVATVGEGLHIEESSVPSADKTQELSAYPQDPTISPPEDLTATLKFTVAPQLSSVLSSMTPNGLSSRALGATGSVGSFQQSESRTRYEQNRLMQVLSSSTLSTEAILIALLVAFGLGAFHALSPGHGKTIVGAYLVGTRGTARHAVWLGAIVTITHTLGVFILGLITLYASQYVLPEKLYPWLGFVSGMGVVAIGFGLFLQRYRLLHEPDHSEHDHGHSHSHDHDQAHAHGHDHIHQDHGFHDPHTHVHDPVHAEPHDHSHHHHDHSHAHSHDHAHSHSHEHPSHESAHSQPLLTHTHGGVTHSHDYSKVKSKDLFTLGVTGGMVPCPSALVVLLSAISLNRVGLGLLLIVAFSLGLALVLMAIGLMMVYARGFMERFSGQGRLWKTVPVFSSLIVAFLGAVIAVQSLISGGIIQINLSSLK